MEIIIGLGIAHISATNCNRELMFGQWTFSLMLFPKISSHLIISQIQLLVMSHYSTLSLLLKISILSGHWAEFQCTMQYQFGQCF